MNLLAAEQRGFKMVKKFFTRRKQRGINPNTSTPVPFSLKRRPAYRQAGVQGMR